MRVWRAARTGLLLVGVAIAVLAVGTAMDWHPYETADPGSRRAVLSAMEVGHCAHLPAFSDVPSETIDTPTPAACDDGLDGNAQVVQSGVKFCDNPDDVLHAGKCFRLRMLLGACYRQLPDRWVRTGLCATDDPAVRQVGAAVDPRPASNTYTVYLDGRVVGFDIWSTVVAGMVLIVVHVVLRVVRDRRRNARQPELSRPYFGIAATLVTVALVLAWALEWFLQSGPSASQQKQARAFADDWGIVIVDPTAMPGPSTPHDQPITVRGSHVGTCALSSSFRSRRTGEWVYTNRFRRGEGSGWQRIELSCVDPGAVRQGR